MTSNEGSIQAIRHHSSSAVFVLLALVGTAAMADTSTIEESARVNQNAYDSDSFVTSVKGGGAISDAASRVFWFDHASNSYSSALGTTATAVAVSGFAGERAYAANTSGSASYEKSLAKLTIGSANYAAASMSVDLGAGLLNSDKAGYDVSSSYVYVSDFGNGDSKALWYDFKVGLWNSSAQTFANSLGQLQIWKSSSQGVVSYLGNDVFRFTKTGSGSGTSLQTNAAVAGSYVRSSATMDFGRAGTSNFSGDYVDLFAGRFLKQTATSPVPKPESAALLLAGLPVVGVFKLRQNVRAARR